jgi:hypothetical protein
MVPKLIIFAGAPETKALKWDEAELLNTFINPIAKFGGIDVNDPLDNEDRVLETPTSSAPQWRSLPLERQPLETGFLQSFDNHLQYSGGTHFFTTSQIDSIISPSEGQPQTMLDTQLSTQDILSQFYEESHARYEDVLSSQLASASAVSISFASDEYSFNTSSIPSYTPQDIPIAGHLSNIDSIPKANYLNSIQPQTMTVNLIVGIISNPPPKTIQTRRGAKMELVELLVGDETRSGFGVSFWLGEKSGELRGILSGLRPRDVVLMRNVALSNFKGKVYGQSLRKEVTKLYLMYRDRVDKTDIGGCYSTSDLLDEKNAQVEKTRKVREWVLRFVGGGVVAPPGKTKGRVEAVREVLPPDTQ